MNIKKAKEQIKNAMKAYFTKDEYGNYIIPIERQRPVFLMGPPGVGKTAIMEQIAGEMGVGMLSYSMTHHTRQSALGLPFIERKTYGGKEYDVSEYTMSEIIASVYDMMEETGVKEGILFLDEINCVSETLAPIMLQFLQYKVFGRHKVPDGWIVVTAGNPPEYNNSVREFDIVTWDRLKRVDVDPDFEAWKEYAYKVSVHPAVLTYLEIKKGSFYKVETTVEGKSFVTVRGWDDLSQMIKLYEMNDIKVDEDLIGQYIQNKKIAKDFAVYYDLFNKYKSDYQVDKILEGKANDEIKKRAKNAKFDERLSLIGLLLDGASDSIRNIIVEQNAMKKLVQILGKFKGAVKKTDKTPEEHMNALIDEQRVLLSNGKKAGSMSADEQREMVKAISILEEELKLTIDAKTGDDAFKNVKKDFDSRVKEMRKTAKDSGSVLNNLFVFCEEVFEEGHEILIVVTELTTNYYTAKFIADYGCDKYFEHNKDLLFFERQKEIIGELEELKL